MKLQPNHFHELQTGLFVPTYTVDQKLEIRREPARTTRRTFPDGGHILQSFFEHNTIEVLHVYPESFTVFRATWFGDNLPIVFTDLDGTLVNEGFIQQRYLLHALSSAR